MITGGASGLGASIVQAYQGDSYSRRTGYDIRNDAASLAKISLGYDVFVNNAYDGVLGEPWADFGQARLLHEVAMAWQKHQHSGWIINVGGVGGEDISAPVTGWQSYNVNKRALKHLSLQWSRAFDAGQVLFRTTVLTVDRLDHTDQGNGHCHADVLSMIDLCLGAGVNTCVAEIKAWVRLPDKQ